MTSITTTTTTRTPIYHHHHHHATLTQEQIDERKLQEMGYQQQFQRSMSMFSVIAMSFAAIGILTGMSSAFQTGLFSGGPLSLFWGWNICSVFMFIIALCLAEIGSVFPTAGGLYYWTAKMMEKGEDQEKRRWVAFLSGNVYLWAMMLTGTSGNLSTALYLASAIEVGMGRTFTRLEIAAMAWGVNILSGILNTIGTKTVAAIASASVWWTLAGTIFLVVTLLVKAPVKNTGHFAIFDFENYTGWDSKGFVVILGFLQAVYTLEGCETAAQVAEEAKNASLLAPVAIATSVAASWFIGLIYMLSLLFSVQSIESVQQTSYAIPIAQLFYDACGKTLTVIALVVILVAQFCAALTAWTASSRLTFALSRDHAFPIPSLFLKQTPNGVPWAGVWTSVLVGTALESAYIGSSVAFNGILSAAAISVLLAYGMPLLCRVVYPDSLGERGPFHLGRFSWALNLIGLLFIIVMSVLFVLPTSMPVTVDNMNWSIAAIGAVILLVTTQYILTGHHYKGIVKTYFVDRQGPNPMGVGEDQLEKQEIQKELDATEA